MNRWLRSLHKWAGLLLAVQFVLWMASGMAMSLLDRDAVDGLAHRSQKKLQPKAWPTGLLPAASVLTAAHRRVDTLETTWLLERPVYRLNDGPVVWLIDARDGRRVAADAAAATAIAEADYVGTGAHAAAQWQASSTSEARGHRGPVWRIDFADGDDTTLYVSASDGRILERRNRSWRLFDVFWMLHIMDYAERKNFNNPLVIAAAVGGLWLAISGMWLLLISFRITGVGRRSPAPNTSPPLATFPRGE